MVFEIIRFFCILRIAYTSDFLIWYRDLCNQLVYLCAIIDSYTSHLITKLHFVANKEQETRSAWYAMISYHREIYVLNLNYVCLNWVYTCSEMMVE